MADVSCREPYENSKFSFVLVIQASGIYPRVHRSCPNDSLEVTHLVFLHANECEHTIVKEFIVKIPKLLALTVALTIALL